MQSTFETVLLDFLQDRSLDHCYFNTFINDLIGFIKKWSLHNFANDNTTAFEKDITLLKETFQNEAGIAIKWFKDNFVIVNPGKF